MSELYDSLARGYLGKRLIKALSLPVPAPLLRPSEIRFNNQDTLKGHIILSGFSPNTLFTTCMQTLIAENPSHHIDPKLHWHGSTTPESRVLINTHGLQTLPGHLPPNSRGTFSALVLNTQQYRSPESMTQLFADCQLLLPLLGKRAHALLISPTTADADNGQDADSAENIYLEGYETLVKSLAKEMAPQAITLNHLRVNPQQTKAIPALLRYFLSHQSSYVTGQTLKVGENTSPLRWPFSSLRKSESALGKSETSKPQQSHTSAYAPSGEKPLALVTGASGGIGRSIAHKLAAKKFHVILVDLPKQKFALRNLAEQTGGTPISLDLTRPNSDGALADCIDDLGGQLHALVHNAGVTRDRLFKNMTQGEWEHVLTTNLWGPARITHTLLANKQLANQARVVLMSSVMALCGNRGQSQYCFSKAGLIGLMHDLSPQLAKSGITINAIAPGFIDTPMTQKIPTPLREIAKRFNAFTQAGLPEDVAEAVALCCDPTVEHFTDNVIRVCGLMPHGK